MEDPKQGAGDGENTSAKTDPSFNPEERFKNFQAEITRKLENTTAELKKLLETSSRPSAPEARAEAKKIEELWYDKPAEAARIIKEETQAEIRAEMARAQAMQNKQAQVIGALVSDYPELQDQNSPLFQKAVALYQAMPEDDRTSPVAYKAAVRDAAVELDIKPKSKRGKSKEDDAFALGGSGGASGASSRKREDDETAKARFALAEAMGLKLDDATKERLKNPARKQYKDWE